MEPCRLYSKRGYNYVFEAIHKTMNGEGHIFNLGHGILPDVPVENAIHFVKECQRVSKKHKTYFIMKDYFKREAK